MSLETATLSLADNALPTIKVHPTAVLSILHSFMRAGSYKRVIGTLLGSIKDNVVEVYDCFQVPCDESESEMRVVIDLDYLKKMSDFHRRVNKRETIVGFYSTTNSETGEFITDTTSIIHGFYTKYCQRPVFLVVDTTLVRGDQFFVRGFAYNSVTLSKTTTNAAQSPADNNAANETKSSNAVESFASYYSELKVDIAMSDIEANFVSTIIQCQEDPVTGARDASQKWSNPEVVSYLPTEQEAVIQSIESLLKLIDQLTGYVDGVLDGSQPALTDVGTSISDILGSLQAVSAEDIRALYKDKTQDLLLVSYVASLAKTQIRLSSKLHAVL